LWNVRVVKLLFVRNYLVLWVQAKLPVKSWSCWGVLISLVNFGIVIDIMRAQGYDGIENMSGIHRGVQARITKRTPTALRWRINLFFVFDWIETVNGLTTKGCSLHLTIKPLRNKSCIAVSTKLAFFKADKLLDR